MELDKNIKNKLNSREIQPSANSWDRLDAMLSLEEKPKKKAFPFYYVAASVLFALGLTFWFTNQKNEINIPENNGVVITNENVSSEINEVESSVSNEVLKGNKDEVLVENDKKVETNNQTTKQALFKNNKIKSNNQTAENSQPKTNNLQPIDSKYISPEKLLASVENGVQNETSIVVSKPNKASVKVDANSLLSSVEGEIDEEYRETTLDKLKRNFNQVKTAVANRNYE